MGQILLLVGGLGILAGPLLPWVVRLTENPATATGVQQLGGEALALMALGAIVSSWALLSLLQGRNRTPMIPFIFGISGGLISLRYYYSLKQQLVAFTSEQAHFEVGIGLKLCLAAGLAVAMGLIVTGLQRRDPNL